MVTARTRRVSTVLACVLTLGLVAVQAANARIYWTNNSSNTIGSANLTGTAVNQSLITANGGPYGVAVHGAYVYWSNATTIGRANLDGTGTNQSFITGASSPHGVAVHGAYVYWANQGTDKIGRANLDGTGANQSFISGASDPEGVAVDDSHIYWANYFSGDVGRANINGTGANQSFISPAGGGPFGVALDGAHVYWTSAFNDFIGRANLDGTAPNLSFITGVTNLRGLAVDEAHVYWGKTGTNVIGRANLDGSGQNQSFIPTANIPFGVVATPLETTITQGPSGTVASDGASFAYVSSEPAGFECRLDAQGFLPCASPKALTGLANGLHVFSVRARDSAGNVDPTPATRAWIVNVPDTTRPSVTGLKLSRSAFAAAKSGGSTGKTAAKRKRDTRVTYKLSEDASVRFTVERRRAGRKVKGKCRTPTSKNRKAKKCDRPLKGSFKHQSAKGTNALRFRGRLAGRKLKAGRYYLVATATDAAKNRSKRKKIKFTIVKR